MKNRKFLVFAQKLSVLMLIVGFWAFTHLSCSTTPRNQEEATPQTKPDPTPPKDYNPAAVKTLTTVGDNRSPHFSPDGKKLIFVSKNRPNHKFGQVYEFSLESKKLRRVTFHDGDNAHPRYSPAGEKLIYSSTTDEIKENSTFISKALNRLNPEQKDSEKKSDTEDSKNKQKDLKPYELYLSYLDGRQILRLTEREGFDSEAHFHPDSDQIVFTSYSKGQTDLFLKNLTTKKQSQLTATPQNEREAAFSPNGQQLVWVEYSKDGKSSQLMLGDRLAKNYQSLTPTPAVYKNPSWSPKGDLILFSSNLADEQNFEIYAIDVKSQCLQRLTYRRDHDLFPVMNPSATKIGFSSNRSGQFQIYVMDYRPTPACASTIPEESEKSAEDSAPS